MIGCLLALLLTLGGIRDMAAIQYSLITPDGVTYNLSTNGVRLYGLDGIGSAPVRSYTHRVPGQPGMVLDDKLADMRIVTCAAAVQKDGIANVLAAINDVAENYRYNRTATLQPLRLRATVGSNSADLYCYYGSEIVNKLDNRRALWGFTLECYDPFWYATTETSTSGNGWSSIDVAYVMARLDGVWDNLDKGPNQSVRAFQADGSGNMYIGGNFTSWDSDTDQEYITKYDVSTDTFSDVGAGLDGGQVNEMALGPGGTLYLGGLFTSDNMGTSGTRGIIGWNGTAFFSLGGGCDDNYVAALAMDSEGNLYAGGFFSGMGSVANTAKIAKWDGTSWTALGTGADDGIVYGLAVDKQDNLYAVGSFSGMGGVANTAYIAKWDGTSWTALGTGLNDTAYDVVIDDAGMVYVSGNFTTANGVTVYRVARWDGLDFLAMGDDANAIITNMALAPDGTIYCMSTSRFDQETYMVYWDGASFHPVGFDLPASANWCQFGWDDNDNLYVGFDVTGQAIVASTLTVTNSGDVETLPTIEVEGSGTLAVVRNETTGREIAADLKVNAGETVTLDLGDPGEVPGGIAVTSDWPTRPNANNLLGKITTPAALSLLKLVPAPRATSGQNVLSFYLIDSPIDTGDANDLISGWAAITGITSSNSDDYTLYAKIDLASDGDAYLTLYIYKDSAMTSLVASAQWAYGTSAAQATVTEQNSSGLGGKITLAALSGQLLSETFSNTGFETPGGGGADIWDSWNEVAGDGALANETTNVHGGSDAAKLTAGASANTWIWQGDPSQTAGDIGCVSFWTRGDGTNDGRVTIKDQTNGTNIVASQSTGVTGTSYEQVTWFFEVPATCTSVRIFFECPSVNGGICYYDDVSWKVVSGVPDTDIEATFPYVTVKHWDRYDSLWAAVD